MTHPGGASEPACEHEAVVARIKSYVGLWLQDRRMKVSGEILLKEIARYEREEAEKRRRGPS